jgi:hypothetical protein
VYTRARHCSLSQVHPAHTFPSYFAKIRSNTVLTNLPHKYMETLAVAQLVRKFHAFMKPAFSLTCCMNPLFDLILSQVNPVHILTPYFFKISLGIILPSAPMSLKWCLPIHVYRLKFYMYLLCIPCEHPSFDSPSNTLQKVQNMELLIKIFSRSYC